jgi:hypothetical protein
MGNALQSTMAAVSAGFIGKNPLEGKLAAIDKGIKGVQDWKANIDKQRLELKQNTAKQIREAELKVYENMPSDETAQTKVLEGLAKYRDQMLINERLVQNGSIDPNENLIFFENGKQSFNIFAQNVADYDKELELTRKRAEGYRDEEGNFVKPTSGALEAAQQQIQGALANLNGMDINFTEKGMGNIQFYEMQLAEDGVTMTPKLDENGERIPTKGANMSVLALKHPANGRSERVYLIDEVNAFSESSVATNYEIMVTDGLMVGNVVNDARNNPEFGTNINNQVAAMTSTITQAASILSEDNGIGVKYIPFNQYESDAYWEQLGDSKDATITVDILDENMEKKQVTVPKYVKVAPTSNNSITAHFPKDQNHMEAVQGYTRKSLVDGLQRKITKGTKVTQFDPNSPGRRGEKQEKDTFNLIDQVVRDGNANSLEAIVRQDPNIDDYEITDDGIVFTRADGTLTAPIDVSGGAAVDAGKILASELGYNAEAYSNKSKAGSGPINSRVKDFEGFTEPGEQYQGLGRLAMAKDKDGVKYASQYIQQGLEAEMAASAQAVVDKARAKYGIDTKIQVTGTDVGGYKDEIAIIVDGVKYTNNGTEAENFAWLNENLDRALSGQQIQGKSSGGKYD